MDEIPYVGFGNDKLEKLPPVKPGDFIECVGCGGEHELKAPDNWDGKSEPILLFYKCGEKSYVGAVAGKKIVNVKSDFSSNK